MPAADPSSAEPQQPTSDFARVFQSVYEQLRAIAQIQLDHERPGHTIQATELVHNAYLRLFRVPGFQFANQKHLVHATAQAMRRILIEHARGRAREKRGGGRVRLSFNEAGIEDATASNETLPEDCADLLALDDALRRLEERDDRAATVVRLRFFAGLTIDETAEAMELSPRTVKREWEFARAWLARSLEGDQA